MTTTDHLTAEIAGQQERLLDEALTLVQIPAPPFGEEARSAHIARRFAEVGLQEVAQDALGNVTGRRPGEGPRVLVVSHMDTVFPAGTPLEPRRDGDTIFCPGIGDNSTAVASLITLGRILAETGTGLPCDLILAASVGEEGLGDLRGMRQLIADWKDRVDIVVAFDGPLGSVVHGGVASRRYRVTYRAEGGHSFGNFGNASALHGLTTACAKFCAIEVPADPKTTLNVGTLHGGTSVNAIAEEAEAVIDMRSVDPAALEVLADEALAIFRQTAEAFRCTVELEEVGNRPGGTLPADHPLVAASVDVLTEMGIEPTLSISSTDANIAYANDLPAVCIGSSNGADAHTVKESMVISSVVPSLQQLVRLLGRMDTPELSGLARG